MAWKATTTSGTKLVLDIGGTPLMLEGVTSLTPPPLSRPSVEWTPISATAKKYKSGRPAYGKMTGECSVMPTDPSFIALLALYNAAPAAAIKTIGVSTTEQGSKEYQWSAYCDEFGLTFPNEGPVKARFGFQATSGATAASATAVTPNGDFDPTLSQGTTLGFWTGAAYTTLNGVEDIELSGGSRDGSPATPINASAASTIPGYRGQTKLSFTILWDTTETTTHGAMYTSANALTPVLDKFKITLPDTESITLADCNIDAFELPTAPGVNRVKISATVNGDIAFDA
jgi:hypothetical protein